LLDSAILGSQPDNGAVPQGVLFNVAPITATSGGGLNAFTGDIEALVASLTNNSAGKGMIFIAAPSLVASLKTYVGPRWDYPVIASQVLQATKTIIAIEPSSFVSGFFFAPEFSIADAAALHEEDTSLGNISGSVPVRSLFQTNALALKMTLRAAFGMRAQGHVAVVNGATW
jgi:hypothetical protein